MPCAAQSADYESSRIHQEPEHPYRTAFQRDRDRIIHSRAFRRLKHKRQVFWIDYGDHYRTRLTHTLEVAQLSRTMARGMGLNEDLTEAIALGHDLGHTPFGHIGEIVLHRIMSGQDDLGAILKSGDQGGFKHNYQSVRIVDFNEKKYNWDGLNLTSAVREGILKHTRLRRQTIHLPDFNYEGLFYELDNATTLEGQIVAICDEIAQRTHDLEDGIRAQNVAIDQVRQVRIIQLLERRAKIEPPRPGDDFLYRNRLIKSLVNFLVTDVMEAGLKRLNEFVHEKSRHHFFDRLIVWFGEMVHPLQQELDQFIHKEIIATTARRQSDQAALQTLQDLFRFYYLHPDRLPDYRLFAMAEKNSWPQLQTLRPEARKAALDRLRQEPRFLRVICDHIAGMTDPFAEKEVVRLRGAAQQKSPPRSGNPEAID